jgi:hypothetical protein
MGRPLAFPKIAPGDPWPVAAALQASLVPTAAAATAIKKQRRELTCAEGSTLLRDNPPLHMRPTALRASARVAYSRTRTILSAWRVNTIAYLASMPAPLAFPLPY